MSDTTNLTAQQFSSEQLSSLFQTASAAAARQSGWGDPNAMYSTVLANYDRFGINPLLSNHEVSGYTFITRPKLNLSTPSLRMNNILSILDTSDITSLPFSVRCWLDTHLTNRPSNKSYVQKCPFYNDESPFIVPLSNNLVSVSGFPDLVIETETTDGGFYSEDLTFAKGSDQLNRTYNLSLTFRDIQGGYILSLLYIWCWYIALVARGDVVAYPDDINYRRINYTCSIYRFVMDPRKQFITKWAKATGCFPISPPIGNMFNFGEKEKYLSSTEQFTMQFVANKVEYMDPQIFRDFNTISKRYSSTIQNYSNADNKTKKSMLVDMFDPASSIIQNSDGTQSTSSIFTHASNNYVGYPFVDISSSFNQLVWICNPGATADPYAKDWQNLQQAVNSYTQQSNQNTSNTTVYY